MEKPIAWKYNDPIEDARWVYTEEDYDKMSFDGAELLRVNSHVCSVCGKVIIEYHVDTAFMEYDTAHFDQMTGEVFCTEHFDQ